MNDVKRIELSNTVVEYLEGGQCEFSYSCCFENQRITLTKEDAVDLLGFLKRCSIKGVEGWLFDDLWGSGYRFDNRHLRVWTVVPRNKANNEEEALEYLLNNQDLLELNTHTHG